MIGDDAYVAAVTGQAPMNSPEMVTAFGHLQELWDNGCINRDVNAMGDEEANTKFLLGKSAMLGIGSWLVPEQLEQAKDLKMGFFNMPQIPGGAATRTACWASRPASSSTPRASTSRTHSTSSRSW